MKALSVISIILLGLFASGEGYAQTAYQGGKGDGHAMTTLVTGTVSVVHEFTKIDFYPSVLRSGDFIQIPAGIYVKEIYLVSVNGIASPVGYTDSGAQTVLIEAASAGIYFLRIHATDQRNYYGKLVLLND